MIAFESWEQEIADVSGDGEYQNADIVMYDPDSVVRTGSVENGFTYSNPTVIYDGRARVAVISGGTNVGGNTDSNPTNIVTIRVQIPYDPSFPRVRRGYVVRVLDGGRNQRILSNLFIVNSDINSSHVASLTFVATADVELDGGWS